MKKEKSNINNIKLVSIKFYQIDFEQTFNQYDPKLVSSTIVVIGILSLVFCYILC